MKFKCTNALNIGNVSWLHILIFTLNFFIQEENFLLSSTMFHGFVPILDGVSAPFELSGFSIKSKYFVDDFGAVPAFNPLLPNVPF